MKDAPIIFSAAITFRVHMKNIDALIAERKAA